MTAVAEQSAATAALRTRSLTTLPRALFAAVIDCLHLFDCIVDRDAFAACHLSIARIGAPSLFSWRIFVTRSRRTRSRGIRVETGRPWVEEVFAALLGAGSCECGIDLCYSRQTPACSWVKNAETKVAAGLGRAEA